MIGGFVFKSLIHFELIFVSNIRYNSISSFWMWLSYFPNTIYWRDYLFPIEYSWLSCQMLVDHIYTGLFLGSRFYSIDLWVYFSANTAMVTVGLQYGLKSGSVKFLQLCSSSSGLLWSIKSLLCFHTNFSIVFNIFVGNAIGILLEVALNLWMALVSVNIFTILIFLIHGWHEILSPKFVSFSISFIRLIVFHVQISSFWLNLFLSVLLFLIQLYMELFISFSESVLFV